MEDTVRLHMVKDVMLDEKIRCHNETLLKLEKQRQDIDNAIKKELEIGDELRFYEVMKFVHDNGLNRIWIVDKKFEDLTIYSGEFFDYTSKSLTVKARGTTEKARLLKLLSKEAQRTYVTSKMYDYDGDVFITSATVFKFY